MPKISIIVPVYNVEKYLNRCLDSILVQTFTDWECLLIDDGSKDSSGKICDEYAAKDSRFKVYHKENGGVSSARNEGIDQAIGEWITFIDSDDLVCQTYLDGLYLPIAKGENVDFVHGGCTNFENENPSNVKYQYSYSVDDNFSNLISHVEGYPFSKLFRLENIIMWHEERSLYFDERMKVCEDLAFTLDYLLTVNRYAFVSEVGYLYRIDNINSILHTISKNNDYESDSIGRKHILKNLDCFVKNKCVQENLIYRLYFTYFNCYKSLTILYKKKIPREERLSRIRNDWTSHELELLKYVPAEYGQLARFLCYLLRKNQIVIFDFMTYIFGKVKRFISCLT